MHLKSTASMIRDIHGASYVWADNLLLTIVIDWMTVIFGVIIKTVDKEVLIS